MFSKLRNIRKARDNFAARGVDFKVMKKMNREQELAEQGWIKQNTYDEPRLSEAVEMYKEIGFETLVEDFNPEKETECNECMKAMAEKYKTIYTRKK